MACCSSMVNRSGYSLHSGIRVLLVPRPLAPTPTGRSNAAVPVGPCRVIWEAPQRGGGTEVASRLMHLERPVAVQPWGLRDPRPLDSPKRELPCEHLSRMGAWHQHNQQA